MNKTIKILASLPIAALVLTACGSSNSDTVKQAPSISLPAQSSNLTPTQVENLLVALMPTALAQQGIT